VVVRLTRPQEELIARIRELARADDRLSAALTYGSFVSGEGDQHSDVEFRLFTVAAVDPVAWIGAVRPATYVVVNEFGAHVAFFPGLVRGEFHFAPARDIASVAGWPARSGAVDDMIVLDRTGELWRALESLPAAPTLPATRAEVDQPCGRFANWLVLALHVTRRGELLRAADALGHAQRHLLWMVRLAEKRTQHWLTPSRAFETDLPADVVRELHRLRFPADARSAVAAMWVVGRRYWHRLGDPPALLVAELDAAVGPG
jgi:lincosamide nucleotidyltransferase